jgi:hypothetical protein
VKESIMSINEKALVATPLGPLTTHLTSMWIILIFPYFYILVSFLISCSIPSNLSFVQILYY